MKYGLSSSGEESSCLSKYQNTEFPNREINLALFYCFIYTCIDLLIIKKYFCAVYNYAGKADLSKAYWNPKRKLGVPTHFSEIIKQQFI